MKRTLERLFGGKAQAPAPTPKLAVAQLLLEIARSDLNITISEIDVIRRHLAKAYELSEPALDALIASAQSKVEQSVSLHDSVNTVNRLLSAEDKAGLIRTLWRVAYADQRLDMHEEALLRRLADLLYVPHSVFIREKLATQN